MDMNALIAFLFAVASALAGPHSGYGHSYGPPVAPLIVDNTADGQVEIFIDYRAVGDVRANTQRVFSIPVGTHYVEARHVSGYRLYANKLNVRSTSGVTLRLTHPRSTLNLTNVGSYPVLVEVAGAKDMWLSPGQNRNYGVSVGQVKVQTTYWIQGVQRRETRSFRVDPERVTRATTGQVAAPTYGSVTYLPSGGPVSPSAMMGRMILTNAQGRSVDVYVDGRQLGSLNSGQTRQWEVPVGAVWVMAIDSRGTMVFDERLKVSSSHASQSIIGSSGPASSSYGPSSPYYGTTGTSGYATPHTPVRY
jgi:hypothetical protein